MKARTLVDPDNRRGKLGMGRGSERKLTEDDGSKERKGYHRFGQLRERGGKEGWGRRCRTGA